MEPVIPIPPSDIGKHLREVLPGGETALEIERTLLGTDGEVLPGQSKKVTLTLLRRNVNSEPPAAPIRSPSPKRSHTFNDCAGFADYLQKFGTANTVVLSSPNAGTMQAILDETAADGFEVVTLQVITHPLFQPWEDLLEEDEVPIQAFAQFVACNRRVIVDPVGKDLALACAQVRMSRSVEMHIGQGKNALNGVLITTKIAGAAQGTGDRADYLDFPDTVKIKVPVLVDCDVSELEVDMVLSGNEQKGVVVKVSSPDLARVRLELFDSMRNTIMAIAAGEDAKRITFALGQVRHDSWSYLPQK